MTLNQKNKGL